MRWLDDLTVDNINKVSRLINSHPNKKEAKCS